jgi:transposase
MRLTDDQWQLIAPLFPPSSPMASSRGRSAAPDDRRALEGILWKLAANAPWRDLPSRYPSYQTCYRRYREWRRTGLLSRVLSTLLHDLSNRGGRDLLRALQDGSISLRLQNRRLVVACPEPLRGTWQLDTALIFLGIAEKKIPPPPA